MIRLAGSKNDGAWFRTNKWIKNYNRVNPGQVAPLATLIEGTDGITDYVDAINNIATFYGVQTDGPYQASDFAQTWSTSGIPREVWLGVPRMTVYDKVAIAGTSNPVKYRYVDRYASAFRTFAINLRYQLRNYIKAEAFLADIENVVSAKDGNPGGIADANKET